MEHTYLIVAMFSNCHFNFGKWLFNFQSQLKRAIFGSSNIICHLLNSGPFIRGLLKKIGLIDSKSSSLKITSTTGQDNKVFEHVLDVELKSVKVLNGNL